MRTTRDYYYSLEKYAFLFCEAKYTFPALDDVNSKNGNLFYAQISKKYIIFLQIDSLNSFFHSPNHKKTLKYLNDFKHFLTLILS